MFFNSIAVGLKITSDIEYYDKVYERTLPHLVAAATQFGQREDEEERVVYE